MKGLTRIFHGVCVSFLLCAQGLASDTRTPFVAEYDFYIGGLSIAEIGFRGSVGPSGYDADSLVQTRGILDLLASGRLTAEAEGFRHDKGHYAPRRYQTNYTTRSEDKAVSIAYSGDVADVSINPPEPKKPYDTDASAHPGTLDPVTAAIMMMSPKTGDALCNRTIPVFDGKRRYDIILLPLSQRPDTTNPPAPVWRTTMTRCFGVYERIAGFEANLQNEQKYFPFDVWFENSDGPVHRIVRLAGKTRLGYAIGTLRR